MTARFDAKVHRGPTNYVGRDRELERLSTGSMPSARAVEIFDISGEPGIGKSRLSLTGSLACRRRR